MRLRMTAAKRAFRIYKDDQETVRILREAGHDIPQTFSPSTQYARQLRKTFSHADENGEVTSPILGLCCFETVGSLGIPEFALGELANEYNEKYDFHDTDLGKIVQNAFHAAAIDERRMNFTLTPMNVDPKYNATRLEQCWFSGAHGIGGGHNVRFNLDGSPGQLDNGLAEIAGIWMGECLEALGIGLVEDWKSHFAPDPYAQPNHIFYNNLDGGAPVPRDIPAGDTIHDTVWQRVDKAGLNYSPSNLPVRR